MCINVLGWRYADDHYSMAPSTDAGIDLNAPLPWTAAIICVSAESYLKGGLGCKVNAEDKKVHGQNQRSSEQSMGSPGDS